ncbi:MAG TPA: methyltransferase domain-containing protein [Conexibacter sp.]|nr:methyltransferase domain-containing protein [Conexibacter sp.]
MGADPLPARIGGAVAGRIVDRYARRPAGILACVLHARGPSHDTTHRAVLAAVGPLVPSDVLLDVGSGAGRFLELALRSGCSAVGVDHSADMRSLAGRRNASACRDGRLRLVAGAAEDLPFASGAFTHVTMTAVFFFLADPARALAEARRVLRPDGTIVVLTGSREAGRRLGPRFLRDRMHLHSDAALSELATGAGFTAVRIERTRPGGQLLRARTPE